MPTSPTRIVIPGTLALLAATALTSCGGSDDPAMVPRGETSSADVAREAKDAVNTASDYAADQYAAFKSTMNEQIDGVNAQIDTLKAKASGLETSARAELSAAVASLEAQRDALKARLTEAADTSGDAWSDVQSGLTSAWNELKNAANDAVERFDG